MNNLPTYCGLVDAKIRASDKDLPVQYTYFTQLTDRLMHYISLISFSTSFHLVLDGKGGFAKETLVYKLSQ